MRLLRLLGASRLSLYVFSVEEYDTDRALLDEIRVLEFKIAGNSAPLRAFQVFFPNPVPSGNLLHNY